MALYDTEPLNTRNGPISDLLLHCYIVTFTSAQFGLLADGAKDKETLESEDMDTWPEPENREMHVGHEWSIESFYSCWFDTTQVGTGRLLLEMHMHFRYMFLLYICVYIYIILLSMLIPCYAVVLFRLSMGNMGIHTRCSFFHCLVIFIYSGFFEEPVWSQSRSLSLFKVWSLLSVHSDAFRTSCFRSSCTSNLETLRGSSTMEQWQSPVAAQD